MSFRLNSILTFFSISAVAFLLSSTIAASQPTPEPSASPSLRDVLSPIIDTTLSGCSVVGMKVHGVGDVGSIVKQHFFDDLSPSLDAKTPTSYYDGQFVGLVDTVSPSATFSPATGAGQELDIADIISPATIFASQSSQAVIHHNCSSLVAIAVNSNVGFAIPIAAIQNSFKADAKIATSKNVTIIFGTVNSPFDILSASTATDEQVIAAQLSALLWRKNHPDVATPMYVTQAKIFAIDKGTANDFNSAVGDDIKAGVSYPFASLSVESNGAYSEALSSKVNSFSTYYWDLKQASLPDAASLANKAAERISMPIPGQISQSNPVTFANTVAGWPPDLCNGALWNLKVTSARLATYSGLVMQPSSSNGRSSTTACKISFGVKETGDVGIGGVVPTFSLQLKALPAATLSFAGNGSLTQGTNEEIFINQVTNPGWRKDDRTRFQWDLNGFINVPQGASIVSKAIDPTTQASCVFADGSKTSVNFDAFLFSDGMLTHNDSDPNVKFTASLGVGSSNYEFDETSGFRYCTVSAKLKLTTAQNSVTQTTFVDLIDHFPISFPQASPSPTTPPLPVPLPTH